MSRGAKGRKQPSTIRAGLIAFASELNRYRSLTDDESRMLQYALGGKATTRRWTHADDAKLQRLRRSRLRVSEIAAQMGRTPWAIYNRIRDLKARGR